MRNRFRAGSTPKQPLSEIPDVEGKKKDNRQSGNP